MMNDETYMRLALSLAQEAEGQTGSNPTVGCILTKSGRIIGIGAHLRQGEAHAEVHALNMAGEEAVGSTAYVTLEPCSHQGLTPPCARALIHAGVERVVVAMEDPNPQVAGKGVRMLREHGIAVDVGLLKEQAAQLNEGFIKRISKGLPFVTLKTASTLDGKIAAAGGDSRWITGEAARSFVHELRHRNQGIMVGIDTVLYDDPQLTARLSVPVRQPVRVVIDSRLRMPEQARMLHDGAAPVWIMTSENADPKRRKLLEACGAEVIACGTGAQVDLQIALEQLAQRGISTLLLEGGGRLNGAMLEAGLIDKILLFFAGKIIGGAQAPGNFTFEGFTKMSEAIGLQHLTSQQIGEDVLISGYPDNRR